MNKNILKFLVDKYGSYNLFEKNNKFYAISNNVSESPENVINEKKAIEANSKKELLKILEDIDSWSNSRGTYENNSNDRAKVYLRANSYNTFDKKIEKKYDKPIILKIGNKLFVTNKDKKIFKNINKDIINISEIKKYKFLSDFNRDTKPELIFEYKSYKIVEIDKNYFGVSKKIEDIDWFNHNVFDDKKILRSNTIKGVMDQIDLIFSKEALSNNKLKSLINKFLSKFTKKFNELTNFSNKKSFTVNKVPNIQNYFNDQKNMKT